MITNAERKLWSEILDDKAIIIKGKCYHVGAEDTKGFRGFSGSKFKIRFLFDDIAGNWKKGDIIITTNLWHQGKIPEEFEVVDNAECIEEDGYHILL